MQYWMPVDLYVGGIEHAILHLLYARFYVKVLHDLGHISFDEPFKKLFNQGMVCMKSEKTGRVEKMSKSKGNVVNPDDIVKEMGSDTLRMYMLFMGSPELDTEWQMDSIKGVKSFLNRLWNYLNNSENILQDAIAVDDVTTKRFHRFLKDYQERIEQFKVNTAVASVMEFFNDLVHKKLLLNKKLLEDFLVSISVMVPHFSSELLEKLLGEKLENCEWPKFDKNLAATNEIELVVQVNGKVRARLKTLKGISQEEIQPEAEKIITKWLAEKNIIKVVFVKDKLISFVVK